MIKLEYKCNKILKQQLHQLLHDVIVTAVHIASHVYVLISKFLVWIDFCFTALQHILGHFGHDQLP